MGTDANPTAAADGRGTRAALRRIHPVWWLNAAIWLLAVALFAGKWVAANPSLAPTFTLSGTTLALLIMGYGFLASVLPVWLLLAPRDYLSAFVKIGVVFALALGVLGLVLAQMAVGELQWRLELPWGLVLVHVALAATVWTGTVALATLFWRPLAPFAPGGGDVHFRDG